MELSDERIKHINNAAPMEFGENEQGAFKQPNGIPVDEKRHVIYMRWLSSGMSGGNYRGESPDYFENDEPDFEVLELVLLELDPDMSFSQAGKKLDFDDPRSKLFFEYAKAKENLIRQIRL